MIGRELRRKIKDRMIGREKGLRERYSRARERV